MNNDNTVPAVSAAFPIVGIGAPAAGKPDLNLFAMAREGLWLALTMAPGSQDSGHGVP